MGLNIMLEEPDRRPLRPRRYKISSVEGRQSVAEALFAPFQPRLDGKGGRVQVSAIAQMPTRPPLTNMLKEIKEK